MSDDTPERSQMIRSTVITTSFAVVFMIIALTLWAWASLPEDEISPVDMLNDISPWLTGILEVMLMLGLFIFLSVTVINLRSFISEVRAGWLEVIAIFIIVVAMSWIMFGGSVGGVTAVFSLGFIVYLSLLQE